MNADTQASPSTNQDQTDDADFTKYILRRPSRRKSCGECFKSKRRCDQHLPACSRCVKLKMTCCYAAPPAAQSTNSQMNAPINESTMNEATPSGIVSPPSLLNDDELLQMDEIDLGFLFLNESIDLDLSSQATPPQWLQSAGSDPLRSDLFSRAASQLNYAIDIFKTAPSQMVLENSTPWSHPLLYKDHMPKSMHDAHAACALYMARNDVNKHMIFRAIESRAKELLAAPQIMTPTEILARVQSLILYQIIRLYDGDIRLRAQGEASMEELELQTYSLLRLLDEHNMSNIPTLTQDPFTTTNYLTSLSSPPIPHTLWIFQESCRRTFLFSFFMFSFYNMLKNGTCHKDAFPGNDPGHLVLISGKLLQNSILRLRGMRRSISLYRILILMRF